MKSKNVIQRHVVIFLTGIFTAVPIMMFGIFLNKESLFRLGVIFFMIICICAFLNWLSQFKKDD